MADNVFLRRGLKREELVKQYGRCPNKWEAQYRRSEYACQTHQCHLHQGHIKKCICHCGKYKHVKKVNSASQTLAKKPNHGAGV